MKEVIIKLDPVEARILLTEIESAIQCKESLMKITLSRIQDKTLDEIYRDVARDNKELLSFKLKTYRKACLQITNSLFKTKP